MCGVKTNVITAVEIHDRNTNDSPILPSLVDATAKNFTLREVSADKGYLAASNMAAIEKHGATPFIAFKSNSKAGANGALWEKMYHFFSFKRDEFLAALPQAKQHRIHDEYGEVEVRRRGAEQDRSGDEE
jgi:hypothetical protein